MFHLYSKTSTSKLTIHLPLLKLMLSHFEISDLERLNIRQKAVY
jgi:hypothetical protein